MVNNNYMLYDPNKHPCKDCQERSIYCHGTCQRYKDFEAKRPRNPRNMYNAKGKMRDIFHKKGRVLTNEKKDY